jgi:hypothetical protein
MHAGSASEKQPDTVGEFDAPGSVAARSATHGPLTKSTGHQFQRLGSHRGGPEANSPTVSNRFPDITEL